MSGNDLRNVSDIISQIGKLHAALERIEFHIVIYDDSVLVSLEALSRRNLGEIDFRHVQTYHHRSGGNRHLLEFQGIGRSIIRLHISIVGYFKLQILRKMKDNAV